MMGEWLRGVDRQLDDRDIRLGEKVRKDAPCPMIESPFNLIKPDPVRLDHLDNLLRDFG